MVTIDRDKCSECKSCEKICPTLSFNTDMSDIAPECIACYHCITQCQQGALNIDEATPIVNRPMNITSDEFEALMQQRRSHRDFQSKPVPREVIENFISKLRFSPTASNNQNLHFTVITDRSVITNLNDVVIETLSGKFRKSLNSFTLPFLRLFYGKYTDVLLFTKRRFLKKAEVKHDMITYNAPVVILIHAPETPTGMAWLNAGVWTGMALLYGEVSGLSSCVNGYIVNALNSHHRYCHQLGIPSNHRIYSCILLGYAKRNFPHFSIRRDPAINWIE